jgi:hypothetical protein
MTVFQQVLWMFVNIRLQEGPRIAKQPRSLWGAARLPKYRVPQTGSAPGGRTTFPPSCTFPLYCLRRFGDEQRVFRNLGIGDSTRHSGRTSYRFDSVAKYSEFPDHSCRMALLGLFRHCRAAFFIPNAVLCKIIQIK